MARVKSLIVLLFLAACSKSTETVAPDPTPGEVYLNYILTLLQQNSVNRKTINWTEFKTTTLQKAPNLKTITQSYQAIQFALTSLKDHHSYYKSADGKFQVDNSQFCDWFSFPPNAATPSSIGYVRITNVADLDANSDLSNAFAQALQASIKSQDKPGLKGWLVDLRGNAGGNLWPMLSGVGPILGEGVAGYFIDPNDVASSYYYKNGTAYNDAFGMSTVPNPYTLINPNPKVALLIDAAASSGEAIAIAFIGRPSTRSFGARGTCGYTTAVSPFILSDRAVLGIAEAVMADRNKNKFGGQVMPDEISPTGDAAIAAALQWLSN